MADGTHAISIVEAARRLGIGRNQGYEAARRGEIPTIRLGARYVVPLAAFERLLAMGSKQVGARESDAAGGRPKEVARG